MRLFEVPRIKGHRLLIEIEEIKNALKTQRIAIPDDILERENNRGKQGCEVGKVVEIGPDAFVRKGASEPYCLPDDHILFVQYAGQAYTHPETKKLYRIINEEDVLAVVGTTEREI